ncbi:hypothetical protein GW17_00027332 [Ensete ventricosum]|nr:hypothetical protein GW17_00027332 [Ensete ventricosum]RZS07537.1 hypothetical protein BHM03_00038393 [Ensete ventricosum]
MNPGTLNSRLEGSQATSEENISGKETNGPVLGANRENSEGCAELSRWSLEDVKPKKLDVAFYDGSNI